ncbi:transcription cofactor vestigial-like protein 4 isoform 1-T1 [Salvelinus alpinus]|uniref:transcription cofactor vestigial-like protein 4 isoform X1 n=2 Tax=Salvelinus alpinus TaxID=8036 RepID=UPI0039FC7C91
MAVANFQYITRMSSGFKVYILEGQPNQRSEDRFRHMANERVRVPQVHPVKRKHSFECGLTLEERRESAQSRSNMRRPTVFSVPQSPTSSWSPTPSPTGHLPCHVYPTPPIDEPLDLIKKPRKQPERTEEKTKSTTAINQMRPSVITCVSSTRKPTCRSEVGSSSHSSTVFSKHSYDHVVEEHFKRSLGMDYQMASSRQLSISVSVDDHFAKALGEKWFQIKSKSSSCSSSTSSPPSSPSVTHSPSYGHSPNQAPKESPSTTTPTSSFWSVK